MEGAGDAQEAGEVRAGEEGAQAKQRRVDSQACRDGQEKQIIS